MKKNKMMRLSAYLLILCLITACAVSGTFAKYVTNGTASDSARVAKFGVAVTGTSQMFKHEYAYKETPTGTTLGVNSVVSAGADTDKVVAPGTEGNFATFAITGTPEVAVAVTYEVTELKLENWTVGGETYFPLVIKANDVAIDLGDDLSADAIKTKLNEALKNYSDKLGPNTDLSKEDFSMKLSWEWPFEGNDVKDTALGDAFLTEGASQATISLTVAATVTQID